MSDQTVTGQTKPEPQPVSAANETPKEASAKRGSLTTLVAAIGLISVALSLFGYGVITGVASAAGLSHGMLIGGGGDLALLSWPGVVMVVVSMGKADWMNIFGALLKQSWPVLVVVSLVLTAFGVAVRRNLRERIRAWKGLDWIQSSAKESWAGSLLRSSVFGLAGGALVVAVQFVAVVSFFAVVSIFMMLPLMGYEAGAGYFREFVVKPDRCAQARSRAELLDPKPLKSPTTASCVVVASTDSTKPFVIAGREALSNQNVMLVWDPSTGHAQRVPLAGMVVLSADDRTLKDTPRDAWGIGGGRQGHGAFASGQPASAASAP